MVDINTILVATDFSEASGAATTCAFRLARSLNAHLYILHVVPQYDVQLMSAISGQLQSHIKPETLVETYYADADKQLTELVESAQAGDLVQERLIITGEPADEIVNWAAAKQAQLLIVGTHGRSGLERFVIGSVAERVLRQAKCAVMVVPANGT
jgi:nucleotide-binding universal stress UspA family protein